jgi:hypothetical protein
MCHLRAKRARRPSALQMLTAKVGSPKDLVKLNRLGPNGEAPETFARVASSSAGRFVTAVSVRRRSLPSSRPAHSP